MDVGGGNETLNTIREDIKAEKRDIKTEAIAAEYLTSFQPSPGPRTMSITWAITGRVYFWIAAKGAFDSKVEIDVYLRTNDGANAVNVILDVVRAVSYSLKRKQFGSPAEINNYGFKKLTKASFAS